MVPLGNVQRGTKGRIDSAVRIKPGNVGFCNPIYNIIEPTANKYFPVSLCCNVIDGPDYGKVISRRARIDLERGIDSAVVIQPGDLCPKSSIYLIEVTSNENLPIQQNTDRTDCAWTGRLKPASALIK